MRLARLAVGLLAAVALAGCAQTARDFRELTPEQKVYAVCDQYAEVLDDITPYKARIGSAARAVVDHANVVTGPVCKKGAELKDPLAAYEIVEAQLSNLQAMWAGIVERD